MNQREIEKHLFFQIAFIVFIVVTMAFTIFWLLTENVSAKQQTSNVTSSIYTDYNGDCTGGQRGYCVLQTNAIAYTRQTNTTYSGVLNALSFELHYVFNSNYQYTLSLNGMSTDFRNNYLSVYACGYTTNSSSCTSIPVTLRFVSKSQLQVVFPQSSYYVYRVSITGSPLTGVNTYGLKSAILTYDDGATDMSGVIDSQNQNTTDIINNNNSNTQDIIQQVQDLIANNEELKNQIIESTKCLNDYSYNPEEFMFTNGYINANGNVVSDSNYMVSPYLQLLPNRDYSIIFGPARSGKYVCVYQGNKQVSQCYEMTGTINFTMGSTSNMLLRVVAVKSNGEFVPVRIKGPICNDWKMMAENKLRGIEDDTNSYLKDDSDPTLDNSAISDTLESVAIDDPLNYLLTLPFHAIQRINYQLGRNSCEPINLGSLYGTDLVLPCINVKEKLGTSLFNLIDTLMGIGILSVTLKKFYDSISNVLTLGKEKEVREKLELPTPMEFLAMIFGGGR